MAEGDEGNKMDWIGKFRSIWAFLRGHARLNQRSQERRGYIIALLVGLSLVILGWVLQRAVVDQFIGQAGSERFQPQDFLDLKELGVQLSRAGRPFDQWMVEQISSNTANAMAEVEKAPVQRARLQAQIAETFNGLREGDLLQADLAKLELRPETKELLAEQQHGPELQRLNRLMIEDAYPRVIRRSKGRLNDWRSSLASLVTALINVGMVVATIGTTSLFRDFWLRTADRKRMENFRKFFGNGAVEDSLRLVHAERTIDTVNLRNIDHSSHTAKAAIGDNSDSKCRKCPSHTTCHDVSAAVENNSGNGNEHNACGCHRLITPEGIGKWLAADDNYAATALTALFAQRTTHFPRQVYDTFIEDDTMPYCCIGLGLGFNEFTYFASNLSRSRMFRVVFKRSVKYPQPAQKEGSNVDLAPPNPPDLGHEPICGCTTPSPDRDGRLTKSEHPNFLTDEFIVPRFCCPSNKPAWYFPKPLPGTDVAIILRIPTPLGDGSDYITHFVVAGRTAPGTSVAGAFLATRWEELLELYTAQKAERDPSRDALLVVLEHKSELTRGKLDAKRVAFSSGATWYKGDWEELNESNSNRHELVDKSKTVLNTDGLAHDDQLKEFAASIANHGYGFYNPNRKPVMPGKNGQA